MKVRPYCRDCLKDLARQVVTLSGGDDALVASCSRLVDTLFAPHRSPTDISNRILKHVKKKTGSYDPYAERKAAEFRRAGRAAGEMKGRFPDSLEGALRSSAFGNGGDFFVEHAYDDNDLEFDGDMAKIEHQVYISKKILVLGDNVGDFLFDLPLLARLSGMGKEVLYAVKEHPAQNDMSLTDVARFGGEEMWDGIISTGMDEVGINREGMSGKIRECWEDDSMIIAKGMGNYEAISEFDCERPVVYIMKVKCRSVAETLGRRIGDYIAIAGGGDHG
ncbi:MAG: ARMT1-like domain-containing protein [Syntrophorhabdales bacterium]|jgi:uncharacterized protein with ATP-grasp and redox domains